MSRIFLLAPLLLSACTKPADIPSDSYGLLLRFGEIKKVVVGPAQIDAAPVIDTLLLIEKSHTLELNEGQYSIRYMIVDPTKYYMVFGGNRSIWHALENELARQSLKGKAINSQAELYDLVEGMKLPIKVLRTPDNEQK
jgi:hypothetical protein